jgi:drug/metabolite transporter (DMT)-like permease
MTSRELNFEKIKLAIVSAIFGTIGLVAHFIPLSSAAIVFYRALLGGLFIIVYSHISGRKINLESIKNNLPILIATGFFMGLNWVLQFEAFRVSTVAIGTVCYNTMPIFLIVFAAIVFKEKLTVRSIICIMCATAGVVLMSNIIGDKGTGVSSNTVLGCIYGVLGAIFYALIVTFNRKLNFIETYDKLVFQFLFSALIMAIYITFIEKSSFAFASSIDNRTFTIGIFCILLLSFFHTGICYIIYFNTISKLKADVVAILTYIDPVVALLLSYFVLREKMTLSQFIGAVIILLSTLINELLSLRKLK